MSSPPLPPGFTLVFAQDVGEHGDVLAGGTPRRALRLTPAGARAATALRRAPVASRAQGLLARRLVDAGMAHPVPPAEVAHEARITVVIPVHGRTQELERALTALGTSHPVVVVDDGTPCPAAGDVAAVCARHGARLVRRPVCGGPGAARTTGLEHVSTDLVAFLDSDCVPPPGWPAPELSRHFLDPALAAFAPRVVAASPPPGASASARYAAAASPLDMGQHAGEVAREGLVRYVPTAALVVRRAAVLAPGAGFDPGLRHGEDVDLVWRLRDAGWRVRYAPRTVVVHHEPGTWREVLVRRYRYGTSAGPLAVRHHGALAPLVLRPLPTLVLALLVGRPAARTVPAAALVAATGTAMVALRLRRSGMPAAGALPLTARAVSSTALASGRWLAQFALVPTMVAALRGRRTGLALTALVAAEPLLAWRARRPDLSPGAWLLASLADHAAYGAGVLRGALAERSPSAVLPVVGGSHEVFSWVRSTARLPMRLSAINGSRARDHFTGEGS